MAGTASWVDVRKDLNVNCVGCVEVGYKEPSVASTSVGRDLV